MNFEKGEKMSNNRDLTEAIESFKGFKTETLKKWVNENLTVDLNTLTEHGKQEIMFLTEAMECALFHKGWDLDTDWETMTHTWRERPKPMEVWAWEQECANDNDNEVPKEEKAWVEHMKSI
tara:strand:- start:3102 stop:3464 length:363 start_codon:yes stop_codon:yes gene_type:complete